MCVLKEALKFVIFSVKNLNVNEIDAILKTYKYKQYKKNSLYCISQSTLCMGEKCKILKSLKNYHFKNIVHSCIISCVCIAPAACT